MIENRTYSTLDCRFGYSGTGLTFAKVPAETIHVPAQNRSELFITTVVDSMIDTVRVLIQCRSLKDSDAVKISIPVSPFRCSGTVTTCGVIDKPKREMIRQPLKHDLLRSTLALDVTNSIVKKLKSSLDYLDEYQYDCAEQLTSNVLPYLLYADIFKKEGVSSISDSTIHIRGRSQNDYLTVVDLRPGISILVRITKYINRARMGSQSWEDYNQSHSV